MLNNSIKIAILFPKDSEYLFYDDSKRPYGGANVQLFEIAKEISRNDTISLFCFILKYKNVNIQKHLKLNLIQTYYEDDSFFTKIIKLHKRIYKNKPDIIIQRGLTLESCLLAFYCYLMNIKFVFMFAHDIETLGKYQKNRKKCSLFKLLLMFSYKLVVQNLIEYNNLIDKVNQKRLLIVKKGLHLEKLKKINKEKIYDAAWIGRCDEWKNPHIFVDLAKKYNNYKFLMLTYPSINCTNYYNDVVKIVKKLNNITFYDFIPNNIIYNLLQQSKIFCLTSDMEGDWPMVVLEAAAVGVPILSLFINYELLIDNYHAGLYCEGNMDLFYKNFEMLVNNSKKRMELSHNAQKYIMDNHDIHKNVKQLTSSIIN